MVVAVLPINRKLRLSPNASSSTHNLYLFDFIMDYDVSVYGKETALGIKRDYITMTKDTKLNIMIDLIKMHGFTYAPLQRELDKLSNEGKLNQKTTIILEKFFYMIERELNKKNVYVHYQHDITKAYIKVRRKS